MVDSIYFKTYFSAKNEIRVEMTIENQCTPGERNHLFPFLMKKVKSIKIAFILAFVFKI